MPVDYWTFTVVSALLMWLSYAKFTGKRNSVKSGNKRAAPDNK